MASHDQRERDTPTRRAAAAATCSSVAVKRDPDVAGAGRAVEVARRDQDAEGGEPRHRVPARLVAGRPEIQAAFGVVDPETR